MAEIFFKSPEHKQRFVTTMQQIGKIYDGKLDPEYGAAVYILTADLSTWNKANSYVSCEGIDIPALLEETYFSGGYSVLIRLAGNLFNSQIHIEPIDLLRLDEGNFNVALTSLKLRRWLA